MRQQEANVEDDEEEAEGDRPATCTRAGRHYEGGVVERRTS